MLKYFQLPFRFDAHRLQAETDRIARQQWQLHYQHKHYEGEWTAIPLRSINGATDNIFIAPDGDDAYRDTVFLEQSPYLQEVLAQIKTPLQAVRLLKLTAGALIKEHRDHELYFEKGEIRLHIPVRTHEEVEFYLQDERMPLKEGECWYMNFNLPHRIHNRSTIDRVHLVIDALVNDWVKEIFSQAGSVKKEISDTPHDETTQREIIAQLRSMNTETGNALADKMEQELIIKN